jgi:hypothetical protein
MLSETIFVLDVVINSRSRCEILPRWLVEDNRYGVEGLLTSNRALGVAGRVGAQQNHPVVEDRGGRGWVQRCSR